MRVIKVFVVFEASLVTRVSWLEYNMQIRRGNIHKISSHGTSVVVNDKAIFQSLCENDSSTFGGNLDEY